MCQKFVVSRFTTFPLRALGALQPLVFVAIFGGFVFQFFLYILLLVYNFVCFGIVVTSLGGRVCNFSSWCQSRAAIFLDTYSFFRDFVY